VDRTADAIASLGAADAIASLSATATHAIRTPVAGA
jgi:hypothetical protein